MPKTFRAHPRMPMLQLALPYVFGLVAGFAGYGPMFLIAAGIALAAAAYYAAAQPALSADGES